MVERSVWYRLPEEVAERIFSYLPIVSALRSKCVCKSWNSILSSKSFAELWAKTSHRDFYFLVSYNSQFVSAYCPNLDRWNNIPIYELCSLDPGRVLLLASSGGLLCFRNRNSDYPALVVCNPVTRSCRFLPGMCHVRYIDIVGMVADKTSDSYRVLVTGTKESSSKESITEVYDSRIGSWVDHGFFELEFLQFWYEAHAVWLNGCFYYLATPVNIARGYRLIRYDYEKRQWNDLHVKMPSRDVRCPSLVVCGNRILLTGKVISSYFLIKSICIWELKWDGDDLMWVIVESMPESMLKNMDSPYSVFIQCQGQNELVCFSTHRGWQSIIYDLTKRAWRWLPENDVCVRDPVMALGRNNVLGLPYEPSLSAEV